MARATEPRPSVGGAMAPEAILSAGRGREFQENRMLIAMKEAGAAERGKVQAKAQVQSTQIGAESRQNVAAMQMVEADRRAAERIRGEQLDREYMEGQTRLTHHLLSEREKAGRVASRMERTDDLELFRELFKEHEDNETVRQMIESGEVERSKRGLHRQSILAVTKLQDLERWLQAEKTTVKESRATHEIFVGLTKEIEENITVNPYLTFEEEMAGTPQEFLSQDFQKLEVKNPADIVKILNQDRATDLARRIADGQIKKDDLQKIYIALKKRKEWSLTQIDELLEDKDKLTQKGRMLFPFEGIFRDYKKPTYWTSVKRKAIGPTTENALLLKKRQQRLGSLNRMISTIDNLQNAGGSGEITMVDRSEKVMSFMGKILGQLNGPIQTMDYQKAMEIMMPDLQKVKAGMEEELEKNSLDFSGMIRQAEEMGLSKGVIEGLKKSQAIRRGGTAGLTNEEEREPSEMDELMELSSIDEGN